MPARRAGGSGVGPHIPRRAVNAPGRSGRGRRSRASRSAAAGASRPAWWSSTKPPPKDADASRDHRRARTDPWPGWPRGCQPDVGLAAGPARGAAVAAGPMRWVADDGLGRSRCAFGCAEARW